MNTLLQHGLAYPVQIKLELQEYFNRIWDGKREMSQKLSYYNQVEKDTSISFEPFLTLNDSKSRKCLMQLRSSSHRLNCETARYTGERDLDKNQCSVSWFKRCEFCTSDDARLLSNLPFNEVIEEDEHHILISCPKFHQHRLNLQEDTKSLLLRNEGHEELYSLEHMKNFGPYVKKIFKSRFPKKMKAKAK